MSSEPTDSVIDLTSAQLSMVKMARSRGIKHTRYEHTDKLNIKNSINHYPSSHDKPCIACGKTFTGPPIFIPVSYQRDKDLWQLDPYACCSRPVCGKYYLISSSGATLAAKCTLYKEFLAEFFQYYLPVPYVNVKIEEAPSAGNVSITVQQPPFTFINTWLSEKQIDECERRKQNEFDRKHTLKASKQQQAAYEEKLDYIKKQNASGNKGVKRPVPDT